MAKAKKDLHATLSQVDIVIELADARAPRLSQNPMLLAITRLKERIVVLNKADLADPVLTKQWVNVLDKPDAPCFVLSSIQKNTVKPFIQKVVNYCIGVDEKRGRKRPKPFYSACIIGIPNIGKSSLINHIVDKPLAKVENKPGVTRQQRWIDVHPKLKLLDTPGILWPRIETDLEKQMLFLLGCYADPHFDVEEAALTLISLCNTNYPTLFKDQFESPSNDPLDVMGCVAKRFGCLQKGGLPDLQKASLKLIQLFQTGKLGQLSLEKPTP